MQRVPDGQHRRRQQKGRQRQRDVGPHVDPEGRGRREVDGDGGEEPRGVERRRVDVASEREKRDKREKWTFFLIP